MYLNGYLNDFMQEQAKLYDTKRRMRGSSKPKEDSEIDTTSFYLMGNQVMSSCRELHDFMRLSSMKQQLLTKLTGVDKASTNL